VSLNDPKSLAPKAAHWASVVEEFELSMNVEDSLPRFEKRALFLQLLLATKEVE